MLLKPNETINFDEARITLKKFVGDQTDVPFEEVVIEKGKIVEVRRYDNGSNE